MKPMFVSGLFIPSSVCSSSVIGPGPKLVWVCLDMCRQDDEASVSQDDIAGLLGTTGRQVRRWLTELQDAGLILEIRRDRETKLNVYRFTDTPDDLSAVNSGKQEKPRVKAKPKARRIDPDWRPDPEIHAWAKEQYPAIDSRYEEEKFRDYWLSRSGGSAIKINWDLAFRNWIRRANEFRNAEHGARCDFDNAVADAVGGGVVPKDEGPVW